MSATNSTPNYELPVFLATDKPAWLTDWNGAMNAIDTAIHNAQATADGAQTTAGTAVADIATINASLSTITSNITSLTTTVNGNTGSINTINSLIGNGQPTTEDKTIIGAINEIYAMIGGGSTVTADVVTYDNTTSGLTASNVQSAIDELAQGSSVTVDADDVTYDNTTSGLTASNVQSAIDELASASGYDFDITSHTGTFTATANTGTINSSATEVKYLLNADKSIGKIFGSASSSGVTLTVNDWTTVITLSSSDMPTLSQAYTLLLGTGFAATSSGFNPILTRMVFNTNGTVSLQAYSTAETAFSYVSFNLPASVYFLSEMS